MKKALVCICIIIGTVIGAGFSSGQEIISFFNRFGQNGFLGIILACVLLAIITIIVLILINKNDIDSYEKLIHNNKCIARVTEIFSFLAFCIMVSGSAAFFEETYGITYWISATVSGIICAGMLLMNFKGIEKSNVVLVPLMIIGIVLLGIKEYDPVAYPVNSAKEISNFFTNNWILSAILYTSYNSIVLIPLYTNFRKYKLNNLQISTIGIFVGASLFVMSYIIYNICNIYYPQITQLEMPMLKIASMNGEIMKYFYSFVIVFAILTTAFSTGYNFLIMQKKEKYNRNVVFMCIAAILLSKVGFSNLINILFPIFGYIGIAQFFMILFLQIKVKKKKE